MQAIGGKYSNFTGRLDKFAAKARYGNNKTHELNFDWILPRFFSSNYGLLIGLGKKKLNRVQESSHSVESTFLKAGLITMNNHTLSYNMAWRDSNFILILFFYVVITQRQTGDLRAPADIGPSNRYY